MSSKPHPEKLEVSHAHVSMSIKPEHITDIACSIKNHKYRKYLLPSSVRYIWFYTTAPISSIQRITRISHCKTPGQVLEDGGIGNEEFNLGETVSKYGYEILKLWQLPKPITLVQAKEMGYLKGPPQKCCWVLRIVFEN